MTQERVRDAASPRTATKRCATGRSAFRPDLVLLDVMMPQRDGFEVCQQLRAAGWTELKIIMLTAKGREAEIAKGLALGADAYVTKPFSTPGARRPGQRLLAGGG